MPTRSLPGTLHFLGSCAISIHCNAPMAPLHFLAVMAGEGSAPAISLHTLLLRYWLPRAKLCCFSAKPDRCDSTTRRSDGLRRCNRASMKFNTFAEGIFLRLPRSCRVAEKFDPIGHFLGPDSMQKIIKKRWVLSAFSA